MWDSVFRMKVNEENSFIIMDTISTGCPHPEIEMIIKPEVNNASLHDDNAMGIWMPPLTDIHVSFHFAITRPAKRSDPCQKVMDITGKLGPGN